MKITPIQNRKLHALLKRTNLRPQKHNLVKQFSAIGSVDSSELMYYEATSLIGFLEHEADKANTMRRKMLYLGYEMRYDKPRSPAQEHVEPSRRNFINVSAWCESKKCSNPKPLDKYTAEELPAIVSQFEQVYKSFVKTIRKG